MSEPMSSPEEGSSPDQLDQQKVDVVAGLKKQNESLGGRAMSVIRKQDGGEFILFSSSAPSHDSSGRFHGGWDNGAVLVHSNLVHDIRYHVIIAAEPQTFEEVSEKYPNGIRRVEDDESFSKWEMSLQASERHAADVIKKERADIHYTAKAFSAVGAMPNTLRTQSGFDISVGEMDQSIEAPSYATHQVSVSLKPEVPLIEPKLKENITPKE